jgi:hypothetical protein
MANRAALAFAAPFASVKIRLRQLLAPDAGRFVARRD